MSQNQYIEKIKKVVEPLRQEIINHRVYSAINTIEDLNLFMQYHVFAVWDFMSLLKALQSNLTCTSVPWFPKGSAEMRYLINEIVVAEESDLDSTGNRKSHFELYLEAMHQCGANVSQIQNFLSVLEKGGDFNLAFTTSQVPLEARQFVDFTFQIVHSNKSYLQAAVFTFGREDLIPSMFLSLIQDLDNSFSDSKLSIFKYYLERHISLDGDHHSHLALQMTANLCGTNQQKWEKAEEVIIHSLQKRINLWDGAYRQIKKLKDSNYILA